MQKVTAIITTKDEEAYIEACLKSIKSQTYKNLEIVVSDSFSKDKTVSICKKYTDKVLAAETNIPEGRNLGGKMASGDLLLFIDADGKLAENWLELAIPHFNNPNIVAVYGRRLPIESDFKSVYTYCGLELFDFFLRIIKIPGIGRGGFNVLVRKDAFKRIGGFDERMATVEDTDLSIKLSKIGKIKFERRAKTYFSARSLRKFGYLKRILFWLKTSFEYVVLKRIFAGQYPR